MDRQFPFNRKFSLGQKSRNGDHNHQKQQVYRKRSTENDDPLRARAPIGPLEAAGLARHLKGVRHLIPLVLAVAPDGLGDYVRVLLDRNKNFFRQPQGGNRLNTIHFGSRTPPDGLNKRR